MEKLCSFNGCPKVAKSKGFCNGHYEQRRKGQELKPLRFANKETICVVDNCENVARVKGHCSPHYNKLIRDRSKDKPRREYNLKKFNLSLNEFNDKLKKQDGKCALCGGVNSDRSLCVDHDHICCPGNNSCGECVRELLCGKCNTALGLVNDSIERLEKMIEYIRRHRK